MADLIDFARDLLTLEINTIVSDGIAAERMPDDGQALIRIAQLYKAFLMRVIDEIGDCGGDVAVLPNFVGQNGQTVPFLEWDVRSGGMRTFGALQKAAHVIEEARKAIPRPNSMRSEHGPILIRVAGGCADIQAELLRLKLGDAFINTATVELAEEEGRTWPTFDRDTLLVLRRIWEMGVDIIVMQTLIRLDGSLITRILDGADVVDAAPLHHVHYQAVDISLQRWNLLVQTAREIAGFFLGRDPGPDSAQLPALGGLGKVAPISFPAAAPSNAAVRNIVA